MACVLHDPEARAIRLHGLSIDGLGIDQKSVRKHCPARRYCVKGCQVCFHRPDLLWNIACLLRYHTPPPFQGTKACKYPAYNAVSRVGLLLRKRDPWLSSNAREAAGKCMRLAMRWKEETTDRQPATQIQKSSQAQDAPGPNHMLSRSRHTPLLLPSNCDGRDLASALHVHEFLRLRG